MFDEFEKVRIQDLSKQYKIINYSKIPFLINMVLEIEKLQKELLQKKRNINDLLINEQDIEVKNKINVLNRETSDIYHLLSKINEEVVEYPIIPYILILKIILNNQLLIQEELKIIKKGIYTQIFNNIVVLNKMIVQIEETGMIKEEDLISTIPDNIVLPELGELNEELKYLLLKNQVYVDKLNLHTKVNLINSYNIDINYMKVYVDIILKIIEIRQYDIEFIRINNIFLNISIEDLKLKIENMNIGIRTLEIITDSDICFLYMTDDNYNEYNTNLYIYSKVFCFGTLTSITDDFLNYEKDNAGNVKKINNLKSVSFTGLSKLEKIGNNLLKGNNKINKVSFNGLSKLEKIGDECLNYCNNLEKVNLDDLTNVQIIGNNFLSYCDNIEKVNLKDFLNLKGVGDYFLNNNHSLKEINLKGLKNLEQVGNYFLSNNINLEHIDLLYLKSLKIIGDYFLNKNVNLEQLNFNSLNSIEKIGHFFLSNCIRLKKISNLNLSKIYVENINNFLLNTSLKNIMKL